MNNNKEKVVLFQITKRNMNIIEDSLLNYIIDTRLFNKKDLLYGLDNSHLYQIAYYMTITNTKKGQTCRFC
jgi:hypothetical protein